MTERNVLQIIKNHIREHKCYYIIIFSIAFIFVLLEIRFPYYFLQDDNRGYFFPLFVYNYKSLLNGEIALYNFHQYLGTPILACMQSGTLYLPVYLSIFLSYLFFGHSFACVEILVLFHLFIAGIGFFLFLKTIDFDEILSLTGAVTWPCASFVIFASNSWVHVSAVAAYFPLMLFFSIKLYRTVDLRFLLGLVITRILFFFTGHAEFFLYGMIFEALTIFPLFVFYILHVLKTKKPERPLRFIGVRLLLVGSGYALTFLFSLPLLLPGLHQIGISVTKSHTILPELFINSGTLISNWLAGLLNPIQQSNAVQNDWLHSHNLSFVGYIPIIFFFITIFEMARKRIRLEKFDIGEIRMYIFLIIGLIAFFWLTDRGLFARFLYNFPFINTNMIRTKLTIFFNLYLIAFSFYGINHLMKRNKTRLSVFLRSGHVMIVLAVLQLACFAALYLYLPRQCFGYFHDKLPYDEPLKNELKDGRYTSGGFIIYGSNPLNAFSTNTFAFPPIAFNFASLWDMYSFGGYETLLAVKNESVASNINHHGIYEESSPMPFSLLKKWGVKWYIMKDNFEFRNPSARQVFRDKERTVYFDPEAKPLFYLEKPENTNVRIHYKITANTIELRSNNPADDTLTINFLFNSYFKASVDKQNIQLLENEDHQMTLPVSGGKHFIKIRYDDPNFNTGVIAAFLSVLILLLVLLCRYILKKKNPAGKFIKNKTAG